MIFSCFSAFALKGPYDTADSKTKKKLDEINKLIKQEKYETAFNTIPDEENEYYIAKKIEINIYYFSQSIMHQLFALKDLEPGETLHDVRTGDGQYNIRFGDPVKLVEEFVAKNGEKPILNYILGLYYDDVYLHYGDQWLISTNELFQKIAEYLQKAVDANCYDSWAASELALTYMRLNKFEDAYKIFNLKLKEKLEFTIDDNYNYGITCSKLNDNEKALKCFEQSIKDYADNKDYLYDAYYLSAETSIVLNQIDKAEKYLLEARKIISEDYRVSNYFIIVYGLKKDKVNTLKYAKELFDCAPENPTGPQMIMKAFYNCNIGDWLPDVFESCLKDYKDSVGAMQNLYFHYSIVMYDAGNKEKTLELVNKAKEAFNKNGALTKDIENMLNQMINE